MEKQKYFRHRGFMFILSAPSGAGKTSLVEMLLEKEKNLELSVSMTTRSPRSKEIESASYFFTDQVYFKQCIQEGKFLEYVRVFDHFYGTPLEPILKILQEEKEVLFDIEWKGATQIMQKFPKQTISVFVLPPSLEELKRRLIYRGQDSKESIEKRIEQARTDMQHWKCYDYVLVNDCLKKTAQSLREILHAERLKRLRQEGIENFISMLCS